MSNLFGFLFFISLILLVFGLIRPAIFQKLLSGRVLTKKLMLKFFGIPALAFFVLIGVFAEKVPVVENGKLSDNVVSSIVNEVETMVNNDLATTSSLNAFESESEAPLGGNFFQVKQVVDGDTIKVLIAGQTETIRLIGIDTPETVDPRKPVQCFGQEASNKAKELLLGKNVYLEADITQGERDKYDRLLRYVFLEDGRLFNKLMISEGYAHEYTYDSNPYKYQIEFQAAENEARENERGLWSPSVCAVVANQTTEAGPVLNSGVGEQTSLVDSMSGPQVKKSTSDICHEKGSTYYERTTNYEAFNSIEDCLKSGGRLPKR